jgi:UDPglucose 6-dehydrogenase
MRIAMIGGGYVGLVSAACFADLGVEVCVVESDHQRLRALQNGQIPIYEPGLDRLVAENIRAGRLGFSGDMRAVAGAEAVFLAVGTPTRRGDGHADLTYVFAAAAQVAAHLSGYAVIVTKSTVPVGTGRRIAQIVSDVRPDLDFDVASNPEFLREGSAITDFMRPDRVVIGTESMRAADTLRQLYRPLYLIETPIVFTDLETAELTKYAANAFLAMKITFINEMADLCERLGGDVHDVARGIGLDGRIGRKFLHPGPGFGGSCFPKDTLALARIAQSAGAAGRNHSGGERGPEVGNGAAHHKRVRRIGASQDDRSARPDLQAGNRRHARGGLYPHTAPAGRGWRRDPRVRPAGHGAGAPAPAGVRPILRGRSAGGRRGGRCGRDNGME